MSTEFSVLLKPRNDLNGGVKNFFDNICDSYFKDAWLVSLTFFLVTVT